MFMTTTHQVVDAGGLDDVKQVERRGVFLDARRYGSASRVPAPWSQ